MHDTSYDVLLFPAIGVTLACLFQGRFSTTAVLIIGAQPLAGVQHPSFVSIYPDSNGVSGSAALECLGSFSNAIEAFCKIPACHAIQSSPREIATAVQACVRLLSVSAPCTLHRHLGHSSKIMLFSNM